MYLIALVTSYFVDDMLHRSHIYIFIFVSPAIEFKLIYNEEKMLNIVRNVQFYRF